VIELPTISALRKARPSDLAAIARLLELVQLPTEGVKEHLSSFLVLPSSSKDAAKPAVLACVGLELYGSSAVLRSLAVHPSRQRQGVGAMLVDAITKHARAQGVKKLFLLTTTGEQFFGRLGFSGVNRDSVPKTVRESIEFATLCPSEPCWMKEI
jgi:N-acetylglutamate synthase-like GNAT family acetyltransferase